MFKEARELDPVGDYRLIEDGNCFVTPRRGDVKSPPQLATGGQRA
jgi:hypothetical protein